MISFIRGELIELEEEKIIVDVGGVGYGIYMPRQSMGKLPPTGSEVKIYTYLNVREDAMQLFGFRTKDDMQVFKLLIGVSGIGPKGGLSILSQLTADELRFAVMAGDVKTISSSPGIGKKTAEKLIIELKDKLSIADVLEREPGEDIGSVSGGSGEIQSEAIQALTALGYSSTESLKAVRAVTVDEDSTVEDVLKDALKHMAF
ncbi:Holliday junction branch migration protein RuvA [Hespellia stercorisuis]|uniref:Holliday junction branch migration complex subunit RuvA n=1 Tax=Hespellia stercorisuis DSM 15480 TaxID=1121950 RepID=A0A1M6HH65_9FIRM|nr:Holliday junction branch migration protein RuvA [Hespellia stercorisuis]SHJ21484.1 Holliday junction DNA helicase subunit RuvA [Hespellia stercorisuis DSM 15480]